MEQQLVEEVRERMRQEAFNRAVSNAAALRAEIVRVANREFDNWHDPDIVETGTQGRQLVREYWRVGVGRNVTDAQAGSAAWQEAHPKRRKYKGR